MARVWVLGAGWGTALALHMNRVGHEVTLWTPFEDEINGMREHREHKKLLPGAHIDEKIQLTASLSGITDTDLIIVATPSFAVRQTGERLCEAFTGTSGAARPLIASLSKGVEESTLLRLSEVLRDCLPGFSVVAVSGPSHAEEVARAVPTSLVAASEDITIADQAQDLMMDNSLRVYTSHDIIGVELGGAFKNIIALAAGICDGLSLGDNTRAALMTRGLSEIAALGVKMGAQRETFAGLAGIGDLIVTCTSVHSRNHRCGILIGQGVPVKEALEQIGMTVEGYHASKTGYLLAKRYQAEMPIIQQCYEVLYNGLDVREAIGNLMSRPKKREHEHTYLD